MSRINLPDLTHQSLNKLLSLLSPTSTPATTEAELRQILGDCRAVQCEAETFLLHQPAAIPTQTMHQLAVAILITQQITSSLKLNQHPLSNISNANNNNTTVSTANRTNNPITTFIQKSVVLEDAKETLKSMSICRNYLGWIRSRRLKEQQQQQQPQKDNNNHHSNHESNNTAALCVAAQCEFTTAASHFRLRNFQFAYESLLTGRSYLVRLIKATFPQHNGNPSTYLLYFLTVSLAAVYHNLAVVAKQMQKYDASLLWILHFVRIADLIDNEKEHDNNNSVSIEDLKEPLMTRAKIAKQFLVPVLFGMVSSETNTSPAELVLRVKAIAESGKHHIDPKKPAKKHHDDVDDVDDDHHPEYYSDDAENDDDNCQNEDDDDDSLIATNMKLKKRKKKDVRVMAARLAAVQSFGERFLAANALDEMLSTKIEVKETVVPATNHQHQKKDSSSSSSGLWNYFFGSASNNESNNNSNNNNNQQQRRLTPPSASSSEASRSKICVVISKSSTYSSVAAKKKSSSFSSSHGRVNPLEIINSISPGDSKEEIEIKLQALSFPYFSDPLKSATNTTTYQKGSPEVELMRKLLFLSKSGQNSQFDGYFPSTTSATVAKEKQLYHEMCGKIAAAVATEITGGKINTCDVTQLTPATNKNLPKNEPHLRGNGVASVTPSSNEPVNTKNNIDFENPLFNVNTQLPGELRHLFFAGIDFASVGLEHTALVELINFYLTERYEVIAAAIEEDLGLLAVSLTSNSWASDAEKIKADASFNSMNLLDFEAAIEVFCAEFDLLMVPLLVGDILKAKNLDLYETGSAPCGCYNTTTTTTTTNNNNNNNNVSNNNKNPASSSSPSSASTSSPPRPKLTSYTPQLHGGNGKDPLLLDCASSRQQLHAHIPFYVQNFDWVCKFSSQIHGSSFSKLFDKCANISPVLLVIRAKVIQTNDTNTNNSSPKTSPGSSRMLTPQSSDLASTSPTSGMNSNNNYYSTFGAFVSGPLEPKLPGQKKPGGISAYTESFVFRETSYCEEDSSPYNVVECFQYNTENSNPTTIVECSTERIQIGSSLMMSASEATNARNVQEKNGNDDHQSTTVPTSVISSAAHSLDYGPAIYLPAWLKQGSTYHCETFNSPPLIKNNLSSCGSFVPAVVEVYAFGDGK